MSLLHLYQKERAQELLSFPHLSLKFPTADPIVTVPSGNIFLFTSAPSVLSHNAPSVRLSWGKGRESPLNGMMTSLPWWAKWGPYSGQPLARGKDPLKTYCSITDINVI